MWMRLNVVVLLFLLGTVFHQSLAQASTATDAWALLAMPDSSLRKDIVGTERVIDLVEAWVADSVVTKEKQRLNGFGGWFIQKTWARYWSYFDAHKQKYVGSMSRNYHVFDGPSDELDINIFVMPHLPRYIEMVRTGFDRADARNRPDGGFRIDTPPNYPLPEELYFEKAHDQGKGYLTIECEVTPPLALLDQLHHSMFPVLEGDYDLDTVRYFGTRYPSVGMTGVWCMDCNHNCRPEIHPMEWLWWLDLSKESVGTAEARTWMVTLMVDGSRRFKDWTPSPATGEIAIPIYVPFGHVLNLSLEKIVADPSATDMSTIVPTGAYASGDTTFVVPYFQETANHPALKVELRTLGGWPQRGVRYWLSEVKATEDGYRGFLHVAASVQSILAMRVRVDRSADF